MRSLRNDTWLYSWFDNTLIDFCDRNKMGFILAGPPSNVCSFLWSFIWNGLMYGWTTISLFLAPLVFLTTVTGLGGGILTDFWGVPEALTLPVAEWFQGGVNLVMQSTVGQGENANMAIALPAVIIFFLIPFVCGLIFSAMLFGVIPIGVGAFVGIYALMWIGERTPSITAESTGNGLRDLVSVVGDRIGGVLGGFCTPISWDAPEEE